MQIVCFRCVLLCFSQHAFCMRIATFGEQTQHVQKTMCFPYKKQTNVCQLDANCMFSLRFTRFGGRLVNHAICTQITSLRTGLDQTRQKFNQKAPLHTVAV